MTNVNHDAYENGPIPPWEKPTESRLDRAFRVGEGNWTSDSIHVVKLLTGPAGRYAVIASEPGRHGRYTDTTYNVILPDNSFYNNMDSRDRAIEEATRMAEEGYPGHAIVGNPDYEGPFALPCPLRAGKV